MQPGGAARPKSTDKQDEDAISARSGCRLVRRADQTTVRFRGSLGETCNCSRQVPGTSNAATPGKQQHRTDHNAYAKETDHSSPCSRPHQPSSIQLESRKPAALVQHCVCCRSFVCSAPSAEVSFALMAESSALRRRSTIIRRAPGTPRLERRGHHRSVCSACPAGHPDAVRRSWSSRRRRRLPSDPAQRVLGKDATPASLAALRKQLHLDRSAPRQYLDWLGGLLHGDLGTSLISDKPVWDDLWTARELRLPRPRLGDHLDPALDRDRRPTPRSDAMASSTACRLVMLALAVDARVRRRHSLLVALFATTVFKLCPRSRSSRPARARGTTGEMIGCRRLTLVARRHAVRRAGSCAPR